MVFIFWVKVLIFIFNQRFWIDVVVVVTKKNYNKTRHIQILIIYEYGKIQTISWYLEV